MADDDGFLSRWSRRKQLARSGQPLPAAEPADPAVRPVVARPSAVASSASTSTSTSASDATGAPAPAAPSPAPPATAAPVPDDSVEPVRLPTLEDVARLTPEADFSPFVAQGVPSEVKNAALKKLFADPRFNVMDGMDVYIDDYSQPNPLPLAMAKKLASAQFMNLFDEPEQKPAPAQPDVPASASAATIGNDSAVAGAADTDAADTDAAGTETASPDAPPARDASTPSAEPPERPDTPRPT